MIERTLYFDHAATTPADPAVVDAMLPYFTECFGNPSSIYRLGRSALQALDDARSLTAEVLRCSPKELIFLGGGSESDNLAIKGVAFAAREAGKGQHIITSALEHHAVLHACDYLKAFGFEVTVLPIDGAGLVSPADVRAAVRPDTVLVSIMYANNEIGAIQPIAEIGGICRERGVLFHTDAVQAAGALSLDVQALNVDLLSLTAHKFYGPKGVGALYVRRGVQLLPQISGGGQERRRRAGTENVPGIVGFATALQRAEERRSSYVAHCTALRDRLIDELLERVPFTRLNGHRTQRLANNANLSFAYTEGESILLLLDQAGVCASSGSACASGSLNPSHVLMALGLDADQAHGSIRLTVGKDTTHADVDYVLDKLPGMIERLRSVSPQYREQLALSN
ncbi:MAG: cysteine desulfurase NifS [Chloroflexota bacterium]|nr:cysteine desulfurase NifS [Chloroflexota bacterium]PLS80738.1 MAG: cysteine desulfurase NifS [Chloroflexota bacterium]